MEVVRDQMTRINSKKSDLSERQSDLDKLLSKKNTELVSVFGSPAAIPPPKDIKRDFQEKNLQVNARKRELEDKVRSYSLF